MVLFVDDTLETGFGVVGSESWWLGAGLGDDPGRRDLLEGFHALSGLVSGI